MDFRSFMIQRINGEVNFLPKEKKLTADGLTEGSHHGAQKVPVQESKDAGDASTPLDVDSDPDTWLLLKERMWYNYEQTLSLIRAKIDGLEFERERLKASEIQLLQEIDSLRQDMAAIVTKVFPDTTMKLVHSDEMYILIVKLVREAIIYGRCVAFEEVAKLNKPFILEKMPDYYTSSKEEYDQAEDDLANASYSFLYVFTSNPYASVEHLLSKKPRSL
nr:hypothetical protein [Tanacetum cinerariifolium]